MTKFAIGQTVTLVKYEPGPNNKPGKAVEYAATVIGVERVNNAEIPHLHLAFLHPGRTMVLASANWRDAFDRVFSVPHEDDVQNQAFYYRDEFEELNRENFGMSDTIAGLEMQLAAAKAAPLSLHPEYASRLPEEVAKAGLGEGRTVDTSEGSLGPGSAPPSATAPQS